MVEAIELVRAACRSRLNNAWYELQLAARTNEHLREAPAMSVRGFLGNVDGTAFWFRNSPTKIVIALDGRRCV